MRIFSQISSFAFVADVEKAQKKGKKEAEKNKKAAEKAADGEVDEANNMAVSFRDTCLTSTSLSSTFSFS